MRATRTTSRRLLGACVVATLLLVTSAGSLVAQLKQSVASIATVDSPYGWITLKDEVGQHGPELFRKYADVFGLGVKDEMRLVSTSTDKSGSIHYRFQQHHDGLQIEGAVFIMHVHKGRAATANGRIVSDLAINTLAGITKDEAREFAIRAVPSQKYAWEDEAMELSIKESRKDPTATHYPNPQLVITQLSDTKDVVRGNVVVAYRVDVMSSEPFEGYAVYLDAIDGHEIRRLSLLSGCTNATATTMYNGTQTIVTDSVSSTQYRLRDTCRGGGIVTVDKNGADIVSSSTNWPDSDSMYTQTHWAGMMTYDYYESAHGRNSYDGIGAVMRQVVGGPASSSYGNGVITIGEPSAYSPNWLNSLDIVGHEWTHGVVASTANLAKAGESEAYWLNESFADIFGSMVECYAEALYDTNKTCDDFFMSEDVVPTMDSIINRDMCNPENNGGAGTYGDTNWTSSPGPDSYPRSGVQNKWFCLLAKGGSDTNTHPCNLYEYNVVGIGNEKAAKIAYLNLINYLIPTSHYGDARRGSIVAAKTHYGDTSNEVRQTIEAWNAVGVYEDHFLRVCGEFDSLSNPNVFEALYEIQAGKEVLAVEPCDTAVLLAGSNIEFKAGNLIRLLPGFRAKLGSEFRAHILKPCENWNVAKQTVAGSQPRGNSKEVVEVMTPELRVAPNPLYEFAEIRYTLHQNGMTDVEIYDALGHKLFTLIVGAYHAAGTYTVQLQRAWLSSGVYVCMLRSGNSVVTKTILVR